MKFIINNAGMMHLLNLFKEDELIRDLFEDEENYEYYNADYRDYGHWWLIEIERADTTTSSSTARRVINELAPFIVVHAGLFDEFTYYIDSYREEQLDALYENEDAEYRAQNPNAAEMYREQRNREIEEDLGSVGWRWLYNKLGLDYYVGIEQTMPKEVRESIDALLWPYE